MSIANEIQRLQTAKADIKAAIEEKGVAVGDDTIDTYAAKIGEISGGGDNHYDTFWDTFQQNGTRTDYQSAFYGSWWTDEIFRPKYKMQPTRADTMFRQCYITDSEKIKQIDFSKCTNISFCFHTLNCEELGVIDLSSINGNVQYMCYYCSAKKIEKIIIHNGVNLNGTCFQYCRNLESITFEGEIAYSLSLSNSSLLNDASVQNIIDCLADLTGKTAQTLTLHADVGAKLTDTQKAAITAKNWTLVY